MNVPILIVHGREDKAIPLDRSKRLNDLWKGSKLVVFDKAGHSPHEEYPEKFNPLALEFLSRGCLTPAVVNFRECGADGWVTRTEKALADFSGNVMTCIGLDRGFQSRFVTCHREFLIEVIQAARNTGRDLLLSVVNWGEVYYIALRETGRKQAEKVSHVISTLPIQIIPADLELAKQAAEFKAKCRMSYADCFAAALARLRNAELVTGDQDFRQVENEVKVLWLHDGKVFGPKNPDATGMKAVYKEVIRSHRKRLNRASSCAIETHSDK